MRDSYAVLQAAGIAVIGVSPDSVARHSKFRAKYHLPFRLLADPDHQLAEALGTWVEKRRFGKTFMGMQRATFVVGADGRVERVYPNVKPDDHGAEIVRDLGLEQWTA